MSKNKLPTLDKKGYAYNKYVKPTLEHDKELKRNKIKQALKENWIAFLALIVAIISLFK